MRDSARSPLPPALEGSVHLSPENISAAGGPRNHRRVARCLLVKEELMERSDTGPRQRRWRNAGLAVVLVAAGFLAGSGLALVSAQHAHEHGQPSKGGWLVKLAPDARARAIETQFRGLAPTMAEVAYRYAELYFGGLEGNWDYAQHMIEEMQEAIATGLARRPEHRKSAEALFLKGPLPQVLEAVKKKDAGLFKQRIEALRGACTACHAAEGVPFIKIGVPATRLNPVLAR
jgi:hypothetical protein